MKLLKLFVSFCFVLSAGAVFAQKDLKPIRTEISGQVFDASGNPVDGAQLATQWMQHGGNALWFSAHGLVTDKQGRFKGSVVHFNFPLTLIVYDRDCELGTVVIIEKDSVDVEQNIVLTPTKEVNLDVDWSKSPGEKKPLNVFVLDRKKGVMLGAILGNDQFKFRIPPGEYQLEIYGEDVPPQKREFAVSEDVKSIQLNTLALNSGVLAQNFGKEAPRIRYTEARGVPENFSLDDYKGKWVLIDFWGQWCGPCVAGLPKLVEFSKKYSKDLKVLTVHWDPGDTTTFEKLNPRITEFEKKVWGGPLGLPILMDGKGDIIADYGVSTFPALLLINPQGVLVDTRKPLEYLKEQIGR